MTTQLGTARIGVLAPLSRPGWAEAGRDLVAGLELAVRDAGLPIELLVRDTAADPQKAAAAVDEFARLGVAAIAGEYHSVVARTVATRADALGMPYLCSSAVLDALTVEPTPWVARLSPAQSHGWRIYADFLRAAGHHRIAVAADTSTYWASGTSILRDHLGTVIELDPRGVVCDELVAHDATALLILAGYPEPAVSIVRAVRGDGRLGEILIGAPAGQPELAGWLELLGADGAAIPFLRYLPEQLTALGVAVRERLGEAPSFVAYEGYDTGLVLAEALRTHGGTLPADCWRDIAVDGTRGHITFSRTPGIGVWQWVWPPVQVADRDPLDPGRFRILHTDRAGGTG